MRNENKRSAAFTRATGLPVDAFDGKRIFVHITTILQVCGVAAAQDEGSDEVRAWQEYAARDRQENSAGRMDAEDAADLLDEATYALEERLSMINALTAELDDDFAGDMVSMIAVRLNEDAPIRYIVGTPASVEAKIFEPHRVCRRLISFSYAAMGSASRAA